MLKTKDAYKHQDIIVMEQHMIATLILARVEGKAMIYQFLALFLSYIRTPLPTVSTGYIYYAALGSNRRCDEPSLT